MPPIKCISFNTSLKSKKALENLDLTQFVCFQISNSLTYYKNLFEGIDSNDKKYREYLKKYENIEKYTTKEEYVKLVNVKVSYKIFSKIEKRLYKTAMLVAPVLQINATCHASYTSPAGKNHYWRDASYTYSQLKQIVQMIEDAKKEEKRKLEEKERIKLQKSLKEKKLRELDRIERQLNEKELQLKTKEEEFTEATKGHIYSSEAVANIDKTIEKKTGDNEESAYSLLKKLKQQFECGEITFEEYSNRKKDLM